MYIDANSSPHMLENFAFSSLFAKRDMSGWVVLSSILLGNLPALSDSITSPILTKSIVMS